MITFIVAIHHFTISIRLYCPIFNEGQKRKEHQVIRTIKTSEYEIEEMTSNVAITEKNEKQYVGKIIQLGIR